MLVIALVLSPLIILGAVAIFCERRSQKELRYRRELFERSAELKASLRLVYIDARGQKTERLVDPISVDDNQIEAWCHLRKAKRHFRYDRMLAVKLVDKAGGTSTDA